MVPMRSARNFSLPLLLLFFFAFPFSLHAQKSNTPQLIPVNAATLLDSVRSSGAHATLVNIWATWCRPCKEEMPDLLKLRDEYRAHGFHLLLVSADFMRNREQAEAYMAGLGVNPPGMIKNQKDMEFINGLAPEWSGTLPFSVLFDSTGTRVAIWEGKTDYASFKVEVKKLLADE